MEILELAITDEEFRNYHDFRSKFNKLSLRDWIKAYINTVSCILLICAVLSVLSKNLLLLYWYKTDALIKIATIVIIFLLAALQRSKTIQMRAIFQKYFIDNIPKELSGGRIQLKKIKIQGNRLVVYYRKLNE